ncbi:hypothetical protein NW759_015319 [Fusarium solani]|nr:hypothetical protein NW759_015319 [Fusarium solani]
MEIRTADASSRDAHNGIRLIQDGWSGNVFHGDLIGNTAENDGGKEEISLWYFECGFDTYFMSTSLDAELEMTRQLLGYHLDALLALLHSGDSYKRLHSIGRLPPRRRPKSRNRDVSRLHATKLDLE